MDMEHTKENYDKCCEVKGPKGFDPMGGNIHCSDQSGSVIRELHYLMRKMANPPRACMYSEHIAGQDAHRDEVRKLLRKRIEHHSQNTKDNHE